MSRQRKRKKLKGVKPAKGKPLKKEAKQASPDVERQKVEEAAAEEERELEEAETAEAQVEEEETEVEVAEHAKVASTTEEAAVVREDQDAAAAAEVDTAEKPFYKKYSGEILLAILAVYVILLGFATISELFDLGWFKFDWLIGR